jgi:hypothetical protein
MLTVDDCNTIIEKWGAGFWYEIDFSKMELTAGKIYSYDFCEIIILNNAFDITIENGLWDGINYITNAEGEIVDSLSKTPSHDCGASLPTGSLFLHFTPYPVRSFDMFGLSSKGFLPTSPLLIPIINGEYDNKIYIKKAANAFVRNYAIDGETVVLGEDSKGKFFELPSANDCVLGMKNNTDTYYPLYQVTFREFKTIPTVSVDTLYKGTPQEIKLYDNDTETYITEFQAYYQGRKLKDNIIHLPYDSDYYVNISVDLKDYRYPFCTVKLKAPTVIYQANSQSDVETAIENGIQTLQVGDNETEVTLNSIELSNVTLINSNIQVSESILTNCQIIDTVYTDNGENNITSTLFKDTDYNTTAQSNYNEVTFNECDIHDSEINLTGTITDSTITDTLIISDGVINIRDNTFTGVGAKEYFPSHLYLTGVYNVTGNTFTLEGGWTELEYNMCLIKATNNFNPSQFINNNTLNLNITYDDEPTNTFYYNIVDDDKIRAVRL